MINYLSQGIKFNFPDKRKNNRWIGQIIEKQSHGGLKAGDIAFIFCSDEEILGINRKYLNHDYYTDVITFEYNEGSKISGDVFISIDTVKENSKTFNVSFENELRRVVAHSVLHLLGFHDKSKKEKEIMRTKEDMCLSLYYSENTNAK